MSKYEFDGDKVKKLYGAMQKLGYQQSLGEFEKGFYGKDNYQKRKAVYDVMTENGADLGSSYEDFIGRMRATSATKPTNKAPKTHFSEEPWAQKSKEAKRAAAVLDGGFDALTRAAEVSSDENFRKNPLNKLVSERVEDPKSKRLVTKPKKYSVPESDVREGGSMVRMVDAYKTVDGKAVPIPTTATSAQPSGNQDEDFATQYISGKIDRKEYKKKANAKDNEAAIANFQSTMEGDEEFLYRTDKRYREYRDKILNGDGDVDELSPETKAWYLERVEARIKDAEERQEKYLSVINSYEHQKNLEENNTDFWRNFSQARGGVGAIGREQAKAMLRETDYTEEMDLANAGLGATESELTDLHALRDMLKGKDVGFFRRFKDFLGQRNNLTFGFQEAADNATLIANKNSKSPLLSSAAESKAKEAEAATMYSRSANLRAKAGSVTAEMLPFVIEMASAGSMTSVAGKAAHKAVYSLGTRMLKSAALKGMEEGLLKATGTAALKVGTRGLSWIAHGLTAGALQTVTAGAGETAANITGRMVGQGAKQEDGSYAFEGGEGAVGAVLHGFTSQLIENATEFMGGGLGYGVGKVASKLTKPLAKVGLGGVTDFFGRIAASPISKATSKTLSKFQIQGIPEEIGEEYLGWAGHSMAGDGDAEWSDFADFQKHKELWATMALSVGAMGAFAASGHIPSLLKRRGRSLKMADRAAAGAFSDEEKWNALRDKLDGTDNNNVLRSLYDNVMQDKSLNGRERKAAMLYAGNLLAYRGANLGAIAGKRLALEQKRSNAEDARRAALVEGTASDDTERIDEHELDGDDVVSSAFRQGYEETSAANAYMWAKTLEEQEGHAMEVLGLSEKELNEKFSPQNAGETLNEIRGAKEGIYTEEQKKAAFDYANTRAAYEGVVERTQDDIDSEIAYRHAIVDRQTNIDFGRLHPVKLFTSEKNKWDDAFLVSGRLAFEFNDKGESVVSTRLSDPTLVVSDAAGRTHMVSPSEFADAEDAIDVDEYKNTLAEHIRQEMEERKYAEMLKAAEEAQANEVEEGEAEVPTVEGESTSEEEKETPKVNEDREQSSVFGGSFNVGDKFSTEDGEFEVVQLTEGEAPIVQNVETGQQYRPNSEEELRAAVLSYIPAFIDGKENTNRIIGYWRVSQSPVAPQNEAQQEEDTASENKSVDEEQEGFTEDSDSIPSGSQSENTQEESNISLEEVQSALDKGEIAGVTPQMAHDALYNDPDLETEEVDAIVENSRSASQANLAKLQKTEIKPRKNESVIAFKKRKAAHAGALAHAEELVRFWEDVQEHRRNLGAQAMQEEENAKQHREAEAAERAKEQAENGLAVAPSWANAEKVVGRPGEFITPNGLRVKGHYVLVESGAAVPSHDARHGFKQSEGFPTDEKGHTLNDRDYERDLDAQRVQREIARNYDARAAQQPVVVSPEGFVLSGNGRTMSGDLAAMENTDGSYNSYVREYAEMWGFTSEQVGKLEHPRIVFVSDNPLPLTTETFAAFNAQDTKTQSRTEKAVKMGKAVSDEDFAKILRIVTDGHETLADFYGNMSGVSEVINLLETSGVITQQDRANLFDGDALSDEGRNLLESVLLGKAFEANPDVVRQLSEVRSLRTSVLNALFYIVENERLNEEFRLGDELSRAINFVYHARKGGSYSFGDKVRTFAQQTELFESTTDVSLEGATVLLLADALNDKRTTLIKSIFKSYNERAEDAGRGQMSLFGDALPSRETLIMETLALLGVDIKDYTPSNQVEPSNQATNEQQQEPKQQQQPEARTSESTSEQGAEGKTETELPSGSVSTSGRRNEGVSTEEEGAKPSDKNAKPSEKSTEKGKANKGKKKETSPSSKKPTRVLVSEEQHLKNQARLKELLRGTTLNVGINPEILALGIQEAAYYLEGGIRTFVDFASKMVEAFGDDVRPYVKAFYNGARDMPELAELGIDKEMTPYDEVREFDVGNFDRETNVEDESKGTTESNVVLNDESPKEKKKNKQEETTAETNSENKENEEQSDLFSQSNLGEEKQEPKSSSLEVGQKVKYRTSSGNLFSAEVKALNSDGSVHLLVEVPNGAIPTMNVANASMSDIVIDEPTQQKKKEKQPPKTNKKNGQRNKGTHGSVGTEEGKAREQRTANENALDGVSPEQIELRDGLVDIMRDAGMDVSVSDAEGQRVLDLARGATIEADAVREAREIERVNAVFNDELDAFSEDNANRIIFSLGRPSEVLRAAGVPDMPMKLYGSKLLKKIKKHGFDKVALRDLPRAVANPIAVFNNHKQEGNRAILTELHTEQGNVLVAIDLGKGADVDFNVVSSVFGKGKNGVVEWINKRQFTYVDEEKALNYLHLAAPIAAASDNQKLSLAANIIKGFENPKLSGENLRQQRKNSITEEMQSIKTKAQSDGTFMLAPNGEPTNLTERQWLQVRTESFKEWFGDWENDPENASKVVDENGEPRVVYHQTSEQFTKFDLSMSRVQSDVQGFFFSSGIEDWSAMGDEKMAVFLNLRNPVDKPIVDQSKNYAGVAAREELLKAGNDGAISFDEDESEEIEYLVLSPSQIKSATDNVGAFDKGNDDIRFYRGQHGEVRGFAVGGRIYLDPKMASDETAIHEYTHLWADALRRVNPAEWGNVKDLLRGTPIWEETKRLYPELADDEDALADEVLAQFSGKHGAKRLAEAREKAMSEADGVFDKAKVASVFDNVRQALKRFWKGVADFLGLHFTSAEEVADKVLSDLLNGVNPNLINREYENRSDNEPAKTDNELIAEQLIQRLRNAGVNIEISERGEEELAAREREYRREVLSSFASQYKTDLLPRNENGFPLFDFDYALRYRDLKMKIHSLKMSIMGDKVALSDIKELKPIWGESRYIEHVLLFRENIEKKELELTDCLQLLAEFDRLNGPELEEYLKKEDWHRVDAEWKEWADRYGVPVNEDQIDTFYIRGSASISDNRIWIRPRSFNANVLVHEYTHLWAAAIRQANPELWERIKELMPDLPEWHEVLSNSGYSTIRNNNDELADEVLAQFSGRHGEAKLLEALQKMKEKDGSPASVHLVQQMFSNVRMALQKFWQAVAKLLGVKYESAEDIADKVLADLLNGVNPRNIGSSAYEAPTIREQRVDSDTREEMQRSVDELRVEVREGYEKAVKNWKYKIKEQWQDSMLALKTLQDELEKKGAKIEEWENAYWAENRMSSMNEEEMKAYTRDYFKPIVAAQMAASKALPQELTDKLNAMDAHLREFDKMNAEEKKRNAVDNYLMLKHGLERNRVLAMRDAIDAQWENPSEASSVWRAYNEDAGNRENRRLLQEGKRSFEEFLQVDDAIRAHYAGEEYLKNREKDYSGLTSMTTEELTELKDVENAALQLVKEAEDAAGAELSALWDKVNKATRESVEKLYKSGLLTPAAYSQMTTMFQWYVPLRGFAEETSDEVYDYVDQRNGNGMGAVLKGADGRKSKADSPIAHIGSMAERSVVQGNRNLMKQHFYRMVMAHPNDLVSMGEIYLHHNEVTDEWEMMTPTFTPNATPEQIAEETRAFEERMQELVQQEPDNYLRLREHSDVPYRVLGSNLGEHQVLVKVLGRDKLLTVNGDPRVAQAVNGRFNPDAAQSLAGKSVRALNRVLAQMATQSNPEFIFRNMFRDRSYAMKASLVKDGARYWQRLERNWVAGLGQVIGLSKRYENGTLNINNELDKMFQEFMMNGGATGVTRLLNPEDYKGEITDIAKELQRGKYSVVKLTKLMKKYIEFFGSCSELITRFATYRTSREMGRSVARAVWDAKEISTNFNKKGAGNKALRKNDGLLVRTSGELASFFRNYVIFTNANIQGFHNQWQIAKKHPLRFALNFAVRGLFTGFLMTLANRLLVSAFGDDDDRYMDLPESARRSNLCFFVPGLGWVKFPLGFNYRSFYGLGGLMAERVFMPDESYESFMKSARSLVLDMLPISIRDSEQPLWLNLVPSGVRPMAEVAVNEDWSGRPIVNEYINEHWPEYRRANNHTSPVSVEISKKSSDWTGGDEYSPGFVNLNPSQFEHIALGLLSGVGTLMGNTYETTANLIQGEELDPRHIPFLRDFLARNNQPIHASAVKHNFYALKDEYEKTKVRVLGYEKEEADGKNDSESVARRVDFRKNSKEYKRYEVMDGAVRTENKIRKYMKEATTPEEVKKLEADLQQVMEDAINDVRAIK